MVAQNEPVMQRAISVPAQVDPSPFDPSRPPASTIAALATALSLGLLTLGVVVAADAALAYGLLGLFDTTAAPRAYVFAGLVLVSLWPVVAITRAAFRAERQLGRT